MYNIVMKINIINTIHSFIQSKPARAITSVAVGAAVAAATSTPAGFFGSLAFYLGTGSLQNKVTIPKCIQQLKQEKRALEQKHDALCDENERLLDRLHVAAKENQALTKQPVVPSHRLDEIEKVHFECVPAVLHFNLDAVLAKYNGNLPASKLLELYDFAAPHDTITRDRFKKTLAKDQFSIFNPLISLFYVDPTWPQYKIINQLYSKIFDILDQKRKSGENPEALKTKIQTIVERIVDAHDNCLFQVISQLEHIATELLAEEGENIRTQAAHALYNYRLNLIAEIARKQNPEEPHMANLERLILKELGPGLHVASSLNQGGARTFWTPEELNKRVNAVRAEFCQKYQPLTYLQNELRFNHTHLPSLRTHLIQHGYDHFDLNNHEELIKKASLDPDFDAFIDGGHLNPAGTLWLLEGAGIIHPLK